MHSRISLGVVAYLCVACWSACTTYAETPTNLFAGIDAASPHPSQSLVTVADDWYKDAIVYHLWVAAFRDSDGDGVGDVRGIINSLDTLKLLGINTVWLSPFFESASSNRNLHGYDVVDHYRVDPRLGTNADIDELINQSHARGIRLIFDFVPNHVSNRHPWFVESRQRESDKRDWFVWRDDRPDGWTGFDLQSDWHELDSAYYYSMFWSGMPDLNHRNAEVRLELARVARFWLDKGFDGMRVDAIRYMFENLDGSGERADQEDQPESVAWFRDWRTNVIDPYSELGYAKFMVAENWTKDRDSLLTYLIHDGQPVFHMTLNFPLLDAFTQLDTQLLRDGWQWGASLPRSAWLGNFVSNHDLAADRPGTLFLGQPEKLRAQTAWLLLGPCTPFLYYGNEIGQPQGLQRGDTKHRQKLDSSQLERQQQDPESPWRWTQKLIAARSSHESLRRGQLQFLETNKSAEHIVAISREATGDSTLLLLSGSAEAATDVLIRMPESFIGKSLHSVLDEQPAIDATANEIRVSRVEPYGVQLFSVAP